MCPSRYAMDHRPHRFRHGPLWTPTAGQIAPARALAVALAMILHSLQLAVVLSILAGVSAWAGTGANGGGAGLEPPRREEPKELWLPPGFPPETNPNFIAGLEKQAAAGNADAQATLGVCYQGAHGVPRDPAIAAHWYEMASKAGHAGAETNLAQLYQLGAGVPRDLAKAHELYLAAAKQNLAEAQFNVALDYAAGRSVSQDWQQARSWYEKAAAQGHLAALTNLGSIYLTGRGVPVNFDLARSYLQKPAEAGVAGAQFGIASSYIAQSKFVAAAPLLRRSAEGGNPGGQFYWAVSLYYGKGVPRDLPQALSWARQAVQSVPQFNPKLASQAHALLARILLDQPSEANNAEAFREASASAQTGDPQGEYALGMCYSSGAGVAKDSVAGLKWYQAAAQQNEPTAAALLGAFYEKGIGVPQNFTEAARWDKIGAAGGNTIAQYNLARCYRDGTGVDVNLDEALKWLRLAAQGSPNNRDIANALAQLEGQMKHTESESTYHRGVALTQSANRDGGSMEEAVKALTDAANLGHPYAMIALSRIYRIGDGVPKDDERADALISHVAGSSNPAVLFQIGSSFLPGANQPPVEKNIDRAIGFLQRAADQGYAPAPGPLGYCYMTASAEHQDFVAAFEWLSLAASQGDGNARMYLERLRPRLTNAQTQEALRRLAELRPRNATSLPTGPAVTETRP